MRPRDVDASKPIWLYRPASHKTEHHGLSREVFIGPKAQAVLAPFLLRDAESFVFDPREAALALRRKRREQAKDPRIRASKKRFRIPQRIGHRYTRNSYHNAIFKACQRSGIPTWGPNRLGIRSESHSGPYRAGMDSSDMNSTGQPTLLPRCQLIGPVLRSFGHSTPPGTASHRREFVQDGVGQRFTACSRRCWLSPARILALKDLPLPCTVNLRLQSLHCSRERLGPIIE